MLGHGSYTQYSQRSCVYLPDGERVAGLFNIYVEQHGERIPVHSGRSIERRGALRRVGAHGPKEPDD